MLWTGPFLLDTKPKMKRSELNVTLKRLMPMLNLFSFLTANRIGMVKVPIRILQNGSCAGSLWMESYEQLFHWETGDNIEDNNVGNVQVHVVLSRLEKMTTEIWPVPWLLLSSL